MSRKSSQCCISSFVGPIMVVLLSSTLVGGGIWLAEVNQWGPRHQKQNSNHVDNDSTNFADEFVARDNVEEPNSIYGKIEP